MNALWLRDLMFVSILENFVAAPTVTIPAAHLAAPLRRPVFPLPVR